MARVLIIDDDAGVRDSLARALSRAGHHVERAANGRQGLEAFETEAIDVVVTDINMPEMDGIELMNAFRRRHASVPIIAISGGGLLPKELLLTTASTLGAVEVIAKPFETGVLLEAIERVLKPESRSTP